MVDTPLGKVTNQLEGSRVATQGLGAPYVKEVGLVLERPTFWKNPQEANAHNMARGGGEKRGPNTDVGGR
jgi:hypothetical protein